MIWVYAKSPNRAHFKFALDLYDNMESKYKLSPDDITYTNLFHLCAQMQAPVKAKELWYHLQNEETFVISQQCKNAMLDAFCKSLDMDTAFEMYQQMQLNQSNINDSNYKKHGISDVAYVSLMSGFAKIGQINIVEQLFIDFYNIYSNQFKHVKANAVFNSLNSLTYFILFFIFLFL